jgi:tRNA (cmo5U34)-methyltransferase
VSDSDELSSRVAEHFASDWHDYDRQIRRAIPHYDGALDLLVQVLKRSCPDARRIVDVGVGTGELASRVVDAFPAAQLTGIDIVPQYVDMARRRLARHDERVDLVEGDVTELRLPGDVDVYVSSFALHHMEDGVKQRVYRQMASGLRSGGVLANADFVGSSSSHYAAIFDELRIDRMRAAGMTDEEVRSHYVEHRKLERPTPLETQLAWLRGLGLSDVECHWKYLNLAIFGARKMRHLAR